MLAKRVTERQRTEVATEPCDISTRVDTMNSFDVFLAGPLSGGSARRSNFNTLYQLECSLGLYPYGPPEP